MPASVRAWLYTVARNRCISLLRARRDDQALPDPACRRRENLVEDVEQRDDLRALLADLRTLPDDQRAALLLAELGELSHAEVAQVLGVRARKVKALVYQARQALLAAAGARAIPCRSIREELAEATGAARRRRHLRDHVARCDGCRAYARARRPRSAPRSPRSCPSSRRSRCATACSRASAEAARPPRPAARARASASLGAKLLAIAAIGGARRRGRRNGRRHAAGPRQRSAREPRRRSAGPPAPQRAPPAVPSPRPDAPASDRPGAEPARAELGSPRVPRSDAGARRGARPAHARRASAPAARRTGARQARGAARPGSRLASGSRAATIAAGRNAPRQAGAAAKSQAPPKPAAGPGAAALPAQARKAEAARPLRPVRRKAERAARPAGAPRTR